MPYTTEPPTRHKTKSACRREDMRLTARQRRTRTSMTHNGICLTIDNLTTYQLQVELYSMMQRLQDAEATLLKIYNIVEGAV